MMATNQPSTPTATLLATHADQYKKATNHLFLASVAHARTTRKTVAAEEGSVDVRVDDAFARWLTQDFHFVNAYLKFLSGVLARVPTECGEDSAEALTEGFLKAIGNISAEALFFRTAGAPLGITLDYTHATLHPTTARYLSFLERIVSSASWPAALVALWAVERVYLDSWTYASERMPLMNAKELKYAHFVRHWANAEFRGFVEWLEEIADAAVVRAFEGGVEMKEKLEAEIDAVFKEVVELEIAFWDMALESASVAKEAA
ncbi:uncharacterized protein EV422DRAFT_526199 [Fimicolochytrium jonesii]|uniref:uncharacterized protein n=1 Tax=Fimicolochytrium jonesii TaxID=1396493 RepID=UPI0022FE475C|nr:uncharacterized protein EV422DRAFT_526199 [Fimicolochytrium jonesii]KAI8822251.1 hypothetical protein EV422DRAFT_526199 [Fimicolochytrium jonesii]